MFLAGRSCNRRRLHLYRAGIDFARKAWFERIGAVGFALGGMTITENPASTSWRIRLAELRLTLTQRIAAGSATATESGRLQRL